MSTFVRVSYVAADGQNRSLILRFPKLNPLTGRVSGHVPADSEHLHRYTLRVPSSRLTGYEAFDGTSEAVVAHNRPLVACGSDAWPVAAEMADRGAPRSAQPRRVADQFVAGARATVVNPGGSVNRVIIDSVRGTMVQAHLADPPHTPLLLSRSLDWTFDR